MTLETILIDIDGTLVASNDAHASAWHEAFAAAGYSVDQDTIRPLIGMGADKIIPLLLPGVDLKDATGKKIGELRKNIFRDKYLPKVAPTRGARDLISALRESGLWIAIATSAKPDEIAPLLQAAGVEDLIEYRAGSSQRTQSKPDPGIVEAALEHTATPPQRALMIGDTRFDIEAATRAKVATIALRCGGSPPADFRGALAVYDDPADLLQNLPTSPIGARLTP